MSSSSTSAPKVDIEAIRKAMSEHLASPKFTDPNTIIMGNSLITNACILNDSAMIDKIINLSNISTDIDFDDGSKLDTIPVYHHSIDFKLGKANCFETLGKNNNLKVFIKLMYETRQREPGKNDAIMHYSITADTNDETYKAFYQFASLVGIGDGSSYSDVFDFRYDRKRNNNLMLRALRNDFYDIVSYVIPYADMSYKNKEGINYLMMTVNKNGPKNLIATFCQFINVNDVKNNGDTALHTACKLKMWDASKELLKCGASPLIQNNKGNTCIDIINSYDYVPTNIRNLMNNNYDAYIRDNELEKETSITVAQIAFSNSRPSLTPIEFVEDKYYIGDKKLSSDKIKKYLHHTIKHDMMEVLKEFPLGQIFDYTMNSAFKYCCKYNASECLQYLINSMSNGDRLKFLTGSTFAPKSLDSLSVSIFFSIAVNYGAEKCVNIFLELPEEYNILHSTHIGVSPNKIRYWLDRSNLIITRLILQHTEKYYGEYFTTLLNFNYTSIEEWKKSEDISDSSVTKINDLPINMRIYYADKIRTFKWLILNDDYSISRNPEFRRSAIK